MKGKLKTSGSRVQRKGAQGLDQGGRGGQRVCITTKRKNRQWLWRSSHHLKNFTRGVRIHANGQ